jgi:hypothetical protein
MQVRLRISKDRATLYEAGYDISDAASFSAACADAWAKLRERRLAQATSIGALMEELDDNVLDQLSGAQISLQKV